MDRGECERAGADTSGLHANATFVARDGAAETGAAAAKPMQRYRSVFRSVQPNRRMSTDVQNKEQPKDKKKEPYRRSCPLCPCNFTAKSSQELSKHSRTVHKLSVGAMFYRNGTPKTIEQIITAPKPTKRQQRKRLEKTKKKKKERSAAANEATSSRYAPESGLLMANRPEGEGENEEREASSNDHQWQQQQQNNNFWFEANDAIKRECSWWDLGNEPAGEPNANLFEDVSVPGVDEAVEEGQHNNNLDNFLIQEEHFHDCREDNLSTTAAAGEIACCVEEVETEETDDDADPLKTAKVALFKAQEELAIAQANESRNKVELIAAQTESERLRGKLLELDYQERLHKIGQLSRAEHHH